MYAVHVANTARLVITVSAARGSSTIRYSTKGRYVSLIANTLANILPSQPIQPTSSAQAFWQSVLNVVETDLGGEA
jgi:hypothetical protein